MSAPSSQGAQTKETLQPVDEDTTEHSSSLSSEGTLSDINNDPVTSTPDTAPDDPDDKEEEHDDITPTEPKPLSDGRFDIKSTDPLKVVKRIIREGVGPLPEYEAECKVLYKGTLENGTVFDQNQDRKQPFELTIGHRSVIKGWEIAVWSMRKHEIAEFTIAPEYAYGAKGEPPKIPPNATLIFTIELLSFFREPITHEEKIAYSLQLKDKGAKYVQKQKWEYAFRVYHKAQSDINDLFHRKLYLRERLRPVKIALHLNVALCSLKLPTPQYRRAIHEASWVLLLDPDNVKALYRRGVAYSRRMEWEEAVADLEHAYRLAPRDDLVRRELEAARGELRKKNEKEKKMFSGIFERMKSLQTQEEAINRNDTKSQRDDRKTRRRLAKAERERLKEKVKQITQDATGYVAPPAGAGSLTSPPAAAGSSLQPGSTSAAANSTKSFQSSLAPHLISTPSPSPSPAQSTTPVVPDSQPVVHTHINGFTHIPTHAQPHIRRRRRPAPVSSSSVQSSHHGRGYGERTSDGEADGERSSQEGEEDSGDYYLGDEQTESETSTESSSEPNNPIPPAH